MSNTMNAIPAVVALVLLAACGVGTETPDFSPTDPYPSNVAVSGTYTVKTVDGVALPATVWRSNPDRDSYDQYSLKSESLTLTPSGTFTTTSILAPAGAVQTFTEICTGTYFRDIKVLLFSESTSGPTCGFAYAGIWNGASQVAVNYGGTEIVAEK